MRKPSIPPAVLLFGLALATTASASLFELDRFTVSKNDAILFVDEFADGLAPPSAPHFSNGAIAVYGVQGTFPPGSEAAGLLTLNTALGALGLNAAGGVRASNGAVLVTPNAGTNALTRSDVIDVEGQFLLQAPVGPLLNGYGIEVGNYGSAAPLRIAQLVVAYDPGTGLPLIAYTLQDYATHTASLLGVAPFAPPAGATEIALGLTRSDTSNDDFTASWVYFAGPNDLGSGSFATPAAFFQNEDFVRARFEAFAAAPEPSSLALVGLAIAAVAGSRRRVRR